MAKINGAVSHKFITIRLSDLGLRYLANRFPELQTIVIHSNGTIIGYYSKSLYVVVKDVNTFWQSGADKHMKDRSVKASVVDEPLDIKTHYSYATTIVGAITKATGQYKKIPQRMANN